MVNEIVKILLETSIAVSFLIGAMLLLRKIFRKHVNPRIIYSLWLVVVIRLFVPISIPVPYSVLNYAQPVIQQIVPIENPTTIVDHTSTPHAGTSEAVEIPREKDENVLRPGALKDASASKASFNIPLLIFFVWSLGFVVTTTIMVVSNVRIGLALKRSRTYSVPDNVKETYLLLCKDAGCRQLSLTVIGSWTSPCLFGLFRPQIIVPEAALKDRTLFLYAIRHELQHYKQKDFIWNCIRLLCCAVYWFHPFVWLGSKAAAMDCEFSCDAGTLKNLGKQDFKKEYGYALLQILSMSTKRRSAVWHYSAIPMANTKKNMKVRLDLIMNKPKKMIAAVICLLLLMSVAVGCSVAATQKENISTHIMNNNTATEKADKKDIENISSTSMGNVTTINKPEETAAEYKEVNITFIPHETIDKNTFDTESPIISPENGETYPSIRERAQYALRELYNLTGYQAEDCYVFTYDMGGLMHFAYGPDDFGYSSFLWAYTDVFPYGRNPNRTTRPSKIDIYYDYEGGANKYPLIDESLIKKPSNANNMTEEELALWYYDHSSLKTGDVIRIERPNDYRSELPCYILHTDDGLCFEVTLNRYDTTELCSISGPKDLEAEYPA